MGTPMTRGFVAVMKRLMLGTLVAACPYAAPRISSQAADLGPDYRPVTGTSDRVALLELA